jgi:hypothetical protein
MDVAGMDKLKRAHLGPTFGFRIEQTMKLSQPQPGAESFHRYRRARNQTDDGPTLSWDSKRLADQLVAVRHRQGRLIGRMEGLGFSLRDEAVLQTLTQDVLKSSEIEGESSTLRKSAPLSPGDLGRISAR